MCWRPRNCSESLSSYVFFPPLFSICPPISQFFFFFFFPSKYITTAAHFPGLTFSILLFPAVTYRWRHCFYLYFHMKCFMAGERRVSNSACATQCSLRKKKKEKSTISIPFPFPFSLPTSPPSPPLSSDSVSCHIATGWFKSNRIESIQFRRVVIHYL